MQEITLEEIQSRFESLPEDLKWAIMATNIDEKLTEIGKNHGLNIDELGQLSLETHMVVLNYTSTDKFEESLKMRLDLPDEKNHNIVLEINEKILKDIKEHLISLSETKEEENEIVPKLDEEKVVVEEPINSESLTGNKEEKEREVENKKIMESISSQKLSGAFQIPTVKTQYSLNNISKDKEKVGIPSEKNIKVPLGALIQSASGEMKSTSPSYSIKEDPYRINPE